MSDNTTFKEIKDKNNRCWGITRNYNLCGRRGNWNFFCEEHKKQPIRWIITTITIIAAIGGFYRCVKDTKTESQPMIIVSPQEFHIPPHSSRVLYMGVTSKNPSTVYNVQVEISIKSGDIAPKDIKYLQRAPIDNNDKAFQFVFMGLQPSNNKVICHISWERGLILGETRELQFEIDCFSCEKESLLSFTYLGMDETMKGPYTDKSAQWHFEQGIELEKMGDIDNAYEEYTKAIETNNRHCIAHLQRGLVDMKIGDKAQAINDLEQAAIYCPNW